MKKYIIKSIFTIILSVAFLFNCISCTIQNTDTSSSEESSSEEPDVITTTGMTFSEKSRTLTKKILTSFPVTVKVRFNLPVSTEESPVYGVLFSNSIYWGPHLQYQINSKGNPCINIGRLERSGELIYNASKTYTFDKVTVATGEDIELYFVTDVENKEFHCYLNGSLAQSITDVKNLTSECYSLNPFVVGGSTVGGNYNYFRGEIYDISVWSDTRTPKEILDDYNGAEQTESDALMAEYEFLGSLSKKVLLDTTGNGYDLKTERLWLEKSEVEDAKGDYSFAVVGDTQSLQKYHPEKMTNLYDWLVANKDTFNIKYVMGVGDISEDATEAEFNFAKQNIYKLSGQIPFSLVMGNHDKYDFKEQGYIPSDPRDFLFNKTFYNQTYLSELDGWYGDGDLSCSYNAFEAGNTKWLLMNLDFGPTDQMLAWAKNVIDAHADHKVIIITHAYLYRNGTTLDDGECYAPSRYTPVFNDGDQIFDKLVSQCENVKLVIAGHDPHDHIVCTQVEGKNGNKVTQLLIDPQYMDAFYGATGMVALLHFDEANNEMTVRYYSTAKDMYGSENSQFKVKLD